MTGLADRSVRIFGSCACIAVLVLALYSVVLDARSANYVTAAERLEANEPVPSDIVARLAAEVFRSGLATSCRPDIVEAAATLVLSNLDSASEGRKEKAIGALKKADRHLQVLLSCSPTDGNLWARLAMVETALDAPDERTGRMLQLSGQLSPFEPGALHARLAYWAVWPENRSREAGVALRRDIATLAGEMAPADSAVLLETLSRRYPALVQDGLANQSAERLSLLHQAGFGSVAADSLGEKRRATNSPGRY